MEKLTIIKVGGKVIENDDSCNLFLNNFAKIEGYKILIHGGGVMATNISTKLGVDTKYIEGRRVTSKEDLDVVTMVYAGLINKNIVAKLQKQNINSLGISGADGNSIQAIKRPVKEIDFGYAGDVTVVNSDLFALLLRAGITPVVCAITHNKNGQLLNTNADTIASEISKSLCKLFDINLIFCFDKKGVLSDPNNDDSVIENINYDNYQNLKQENIVTDGMIPKLDNAFSCIDKGVTKVILTHHNKITGRNGTIIS